MFARTPEELDVLLEDALLLADAGDVRDLFEVDGVLATSNGTRFRLPGDADAVAGSFGGGAYAAGGSTVLQVADTALVIGECSISVMRRAADRRWRFLACFLNSERSAS